MHSIAVPDARAATRLKELISLEGVRDNQLMGYGLVVGLAGTGDRQRKHARGELSVRSQKFCWPQRAHGRMQSCSCVSVCCHSLSPTRAPGLRIPVVKDWMNRSRRNWG